MTMSDIDEITMRLVHYFITKESYQPVIVNGVNNEIWLENPERKYSVIRINSNYIHNDEQLDYDLFKTKNVIKQIKKKTFSFKCDTLSILLNVGDNVDVNRDVKHFDICQLSDIKDLETNDFVNNTFPELKNDVINSNDELDFFINVTNDINNETEKRNKIYEKTFKKKTIVVTYVLIAINVLIYMLQVAKVLDFNYFAMNWIPFKLNHEYYRAFTAMFFHLDEVHIICNMYSLYIIGTQVEQVLGKLKFIVVYLLSGIFGCLLSGTVNIITNSNVNSVGASGAIFGLMGALLYFGYHYRLYFGNVVIRQILPVILINLFLGFSLQSVDNFGHIGGLVGGFFASMIVGVEGKTDKTDRTNGIIVTTILFAFLVYMLLFR